MSVIEIWRKKNIIAFFLYPFSLIYRLIIFIRRTLFKINILKSYRVSAPVIVVGNISVGGTGKTPLVIAIVNALQEKGFKPGIILRGFKGKSNTWPIEVSANADPVEVGDEAVLLARKTNVVVIAGPNRVSDAQLAIKEGCNVIVSDDGLQHYRLQRDMEIAVVDGDEEFGNTFCLPAGPLREPLSRLKTVDVVVVNGRHMQFVIDAFVNIADPHKKITIDALKQKKIIALAAIGNPNRFFKSLRALGLTFTTRVFPDHYYFQQKDLRCASDEIIIMTEKDAVKCVTFAGQQDYMACGGVQVDPALLDGVLCCAITFFENNRY